MSSTSPSFPSSGTFLQSIRVSSRLLRQHANISIDPDGIKRLLLSPAFRTSFERVSVPHNAFPLKFPSVLSELNFLSILSILNFGSGYRVPLHTATGRGAWDNIRLLMFSLFLNSSTGGEGDHLSARGMQNIQEQKIAELLGVSLHVERPHERIAGVTVGELGGPIYELVKLVAGTLNETGMVLVQAGYPNLGSFVLEALQEGKKTKSTNETAPDVDIVLDRLIRVFPAFRDMAIVDGLPIYCFKKALFLIHVVAVRFGSMTPPPFPIPNISKIPIFTDNVIPSMLIHLGVIDLSSASLLPPIFPDTNFDSKLHALLAEAHLELDVDNDTKITPKEGPVLTVDQSYILRAAAIDACELIVDTAHSLDTATLGPDLEWIKDITLPQLDMWLWSVAKDRPDYRKLERFVLRDTVFF